MIENTLSKIIEKKKFRINELKKSVSLENLKKKINQYKPYLNFKNKIIKNNSNNKTSIIAEIKKASPSAGIIIENYNPVEIAQKYYENNVTCLSVLTEEDFFLGKLEHISDIKKKLTFQYFVKTFLLIFSKFI